MITRHLTKILLAACALTSVAHAQTLVKYEFPTNVVATSSIPTTSAANVSGTSVTATGSTVNNPSGNPYVVGFNGNLFIKGDVIDNTTLNTAEYFEFTVTAATGYVLNLSSLKFDLGTHDADITSGGAYTVSSAVRSSLDFGTDITLNTGPSATHVSSVNGTSYTTDITGDLSNIAGYQSISSVTFRFYSFGDNSTSSNVFNRYDNIAIEGTVTAIPEPSTFAALAGLSVLGLVAFRRRRAS